MASYVTSFWCMRYTDNECSSILISSSTIFLFIVAINFTIYVMAINQIYLLWIQRTQLNYVTPLAVYCDIINI